MHPRHALGLIYVLQMSKPRTFQELATKAHDMEVTIASHRDSSFCSAEARNDEVDYKKNVNYSKSTTKEAMPTFTSQPVRITRKPKQEDKKSPSFQVATRKRPTLKELQEKKYPFPDSDLPGMLDDLLEKGVIDLPTPKRPEEAERTTDPRYCRFHRIVSHPLEKCVTLKERIMQLAGEGRIILDLDEIVEANHITVQEVDETDFEMDLIKELEASGKYFPKSFCDSAAVYTTSCFEPDDGETNEEFIVPLKRDDKVMTVLKAKQSEPSNTQKDIAIQGGSVTVPKVGLGRAPPQPVRISGRGKSKQSLTQYIATKEVGDDEGEKAKSNSEVLVFNRLQPRASCQRPSVFSRIGKGRIIKPFVSQKLKKDEQSQPSVFARIKTGKMPSSAPSSQKKDSMFSRLGETNEVRSSIPSHMKRVTTLDIRMDGALKMKRRVLILTGHGVKVSSKERSSEEEQTSSSHVTSQETSGFP